MEIIFYKKIKYNYFFPAGAFNGSCIQPIKNRGRNFNNCPLDCYFLGTIIIIEGERIYNPVPVKYRICRINDIISTLINSRILTLDSPPIIKFPSTNG